MKHALFALLAASCGRFGFGDQGHPTVGDGGSDVTSSDGGDAGNLPPFVPYWTSGTRMRARLFVVGDGGDPIFYGWHDSQLDTDCANATAADGAERCMPVHAHADVYYADAACTVPLGWTYGLCGHDNYAFQNVGGLVHEFPMTAPYTGQVYASGPCTPVSGPSKGTVWSLGAEVPATTFAATKYRTTVVGAYNHVFAGWGDGSWQDLAQLTFNQGSCSPTGGVASGTSVCKPSNDTVMTPVYRDSGCTQRAYYTTDSAPSNEFIVNDTTLCGVAFTTYGTTAVLPGPNYYTLGTTGCSLQSVGSGTLVTGSVVDPYPHGTIAVSPRRGRIGYLTWDAGDGILMPLAEWDHDLGRSCRPFIAQDGIVRCLPRTPREITASPDGACSATPKMVAGDCYGLNPVDGVTYASCDDGAVAIHMLAPIAALSYQNEATCVSLGSGYDPSAITGTVVPATTFAALTEMIE